MSTVALYQKYRSRTFDEIVGQEYVVKAIRNAVRDNKVGHAYLFCGPRGTGKTSMARLLARAVNCQNPAEAPCNHCPDCIAAIEGTHPDIVEINAANETHVEDIRDLIDRARLSPMMGHHKIYIIDEVHQLSSSAASALLKILEEPPEHVIFILATTDPQKLLKTIISRCQRFDFSKVETAKIRDHLLAVAGNESFQLDAPAAMKIAELADGGMRDSLSILEQARAYGNGVITEDVIDSIFGLASSAERIALLQDIMNGEIASVLQRIRSCEDHGVDIQRLTEDLITALKDGVIYSYTKTAELLHSLEESQAELLAKEGASRLLNMIDSLIHAQERYRFSRSALSVFEVACLEMITAAASVIPMVPAEIRPAANTAKGKETAVSGAPSPAPAVPAEPASASVTAAVTEPSPAPVRPAVTKTVTVKEPEAEDVLQILVQCSKNIRKEDEGRLSELANTLEASRYSAALRQLEFRTSGTDVLLFTGKTSAVHMYCEPEFHREFYFYLKDHGIDKMPEIFEIRLYDEAVEEFRVRYKNKTLPEAKKIIRYQTEQAPTEEEKRDDIEQRVIDLFGRENISIVEEGE